MRETAVYAAVIAVLAVLIAVEGVRGATLEAQVPVAPKDLYAALGQKNTKLQIIDVRTAADYEDTHVPGALPYPSCDDTLVAPAAKERILPSVSTVIVASDAAVAERCRAHFAFARVLAGGMEAWSDANLPEDSGAYTPPKASAGGGCL